MLFLITTSYHSLVPLISNPLCTIEYSWSNKTTFWLFLECQDLVKRILTANLQKRITITEILRHPWFDEVSRALIKIIHFSFHLKAFHAVTFKTTFLANLFQPESYVSELGHSQYRQKGSKQGRSKKLWRAGGQGDFEHSPMADRSYEMINDVYGLSWKREEPQLHQLHPSGYVTWGESG